LAFTIEHDWRLGWRRACSPSKQSKIRFVRIYAVTKNGERSFWQPIGAAWVHNDWWGFNVKIDFLPLDGAEIVIRKPKVDEADAPAGETA
jgi:hypothetical protein